jgi:hypothetical protein
MTRKPLRRASVSRSIGPVIGYQQCSVRTRAACRFSSCASIRPANVSKRFSAAGFSFARYGGSCPRWVVRAAFARPDEVQVQLAELPDGAAFLCFARGVTRPAARWVIQHPPMSWQWGATSLMQASWSTPMVANSTVPRRHWSVVSAVRSTELPQPGVPAAATSADASSDDRERQPLSFRPRLMAGPLCIAFRFCCP